LRLGREKALERINDQSLIERVIDCLAPISYEILVITSEEQFKFIDTASLKARVIVDFYPGKGALAGIYTGLKSADSFYSLVVGCDMPFLNYALLNYLIDLVPSYDAVVPKIDDMLEPLHAIYSKNCLAPIDKLLHQDKLQITQLFALVKPRYVGQDEIAKFDPENLSFFNINTQDDLTRAKAMIDKAQRVTPCREK